MSEPAMPPVMILCGGRGTRLRDVTELAPKPMVPIGEHPIVWHIMKSYAAFGARRFILCLGYKRESFVDYFANYPLRAADSRIRPGNPPSIEILGAQADSDWEITLAGTGVDTMTGGRVAVAARHLNESDRHFFLTYGDGVADIDIAAVYRRHLSGGKLLTVSAVHPAARFGEILLDGDRVVGFEEKPVRSSGYVNGGFMAVDRRFIGRYLSGGDCYFEEEPMRRAVADGEMQVCRHEGFWQCMDTPREYRMLNELWNAGGAPWTRYWK